MNDMEGEIIEDHKTGSNMMWILVVCAIVLIGGGVYFFLYVAPQNVDQSDEQSKTSPTPEPQLSGTIYFSDKTEDSYRSVMYAYDAAEKTTSKLEDDGETYYRAPLPVEWGTPGLTYLAAPYEPNNKWFYPYTEYLTLWHNTATGTVHVLDQDVGELQGVQWSDEAQQYAFMGLSSTATENQENVNINDLSNWSIYTVTPDGGLEERTSGIRPLWSQDGSAIYFLRTDGIYRYELAVDDVRVITNNDTEDMDWHFSRGSQFGVNTDESTLVIVDRDDNGFFIYDVGSLRSGGLRSLGFFRTEGEVSPESIVFGPSASTFVYYGISGDTASFYAYNTETHEQHRLSGVDVSAEPDHVFLTAWK